MKKMKMGIICLLMVLPFSGFAQINTFDISKYKAPDYKTRALETNFNLSGDNTLRNSESDYSVPPNKKGNSVDLNFRFDLYFNQSINNLKLQRNFSIYANSAFRFSDYNFTPDLNSDKTLNFSTNSIDITRENRRYFKKNLFLETNVLLESYYNTRYEKTQNPDGTSTEYHAENYSLSADFPIKIGKGRIEEVGDARHAVYILDELSKIDRTSATKSDAEITEFANLITQLRNKRFLDTRLRKMAEIETLDSFLLSKNYITNHDANYFTTLRDFWDYGFNSNRKSGARISGVLIPSIDYYNDLQNDNQRLGTLIKGGIEYNYEKPLNLLWQHSLSVFGYVGMGDTDNSTPATYSAYTLLNLGINQGIGFYPNTRTELFLGYQVRYQHFLYDLHTTKNVDASSNLGIQYYISPKLSFNVNYSFRFYLNNDYFDENTYSKSNNTNNSLNISLRYRFF